jgi:hypothetical protein
MMRARRWALALVITLMLVDAWMPEAAASTGPRRTDGSGGRAMARP